ncbi:MAG: hypothetical protein NC120_09000 [Ruminococcus sp.]|nr:hypothetical protein [Ruminococcus sp.]
MSRTESSLKNLYTALVGQAAGVLVSFFSRRVFIGMLSEEYLGLSGIFTNILTIFSLAELGVGEAMNFSLYKPLAEKNTPLIKSLMRLYKKAYILIGCTIAVISFLFTPFYTLFMDTVPDIDHLTLIYWLFAANTAVSYFFSYKRALIICDEKRYIATVYRYGFYFAMNIAQIVILLLTGNYLLYLAAQVIFTFAENAGVSAKADSMYPYLRDRDVLPVPAEISGDIKKNIGAMLIHKVGSMVVFSTDNLILSKFVGLTSVGMYSNYYLITDALKKITRQAFNSVTASVGNLNASRDEKDRQKLIKTFDRIFFLDFYIYGFCSCCLWSLFNPFISLWLKESLIFDDMTVAVIVINFYLGGIREAALTFRTATGAFYYDRFKPIAESLINIVFSVILAKLIGTAGVFIGTIVSTLSTCIWIEPLVLYKYVFKTSCRGYFARLAVYTLVSALGCAVTGYVCSLISFGGGVRDFIIKMLVCAVLPNVIFICVFGRREEFAYFKSLILSMLKKLTKKRR